MPALTNAEKKLLAREAEMSGVPAHISAESLRLALDIRSRTTFDALIATGVLGTPKTYHNAANAPRYFVVADVLQFLKTREMNRERTERLARAKAQSILRKSERR